MDAISLLTFVMNCCEVVLHFYVYCLLIVFRRKISTKSLDQHNVKPMKYVLQQLNADSVMFKHVKSRNSTWLKMAINDQHRNSTKQRNY